VQVVAHQRAAGALWVVVLGLREAVVKEEGRAARHAFGQSGHECLSLSMGLGDGAGHVLAVGALGGGAHAFGGGAVQPYEARWHIGGTAWRRLRGQVGSGLWASQAHAALHPVFTVPAHQVHRHGIEHLVAHDHAFHRVGQAVGPDHLVDEFGVLLLQALVLAVAQGA